MLLLDSNLSPRLVSRLSDLYPGICHVRELRLDAVSDERVWLYAKIHKLHVVTKDNDFTHLLHQSGFPPKVIRLDCGNVSTAYIESLLINNKKNISSFIQDENLGLMVLQ